MADDALTKLNFTGCWNPSADRVNGPDNALLRLDNMEPDSEGVLTLRPGSNKYAQDLTNPAGLVASLFSVILNGTLYEMASVGEQLQSNGGNVLPTPSYTYDAYFGSGFGQIFMARGPYRYKFDGSLGCNWGIAAPAIPGHDDPNDSSYIAPFTAVPCAANSLALDAFASGDLTWSNMFGTSSYIADREGNATQATQISADVTSLKGQIFGDLGGVVDFSKYADDELSDENDLFQFDLYMKNSANVMSIQVSICVDDVPQYLVNYYTKQLTYGTLVLSASQNRQQTLDKHNADVARIRRNLGNAPPYAIDQALSHLQDPSQNLDAYGPEISRSPTDLPQGKDGWQTISIRKSDFARFGTDLNKDWSNVSGIMITVQTSVGGSDSLTAFANMKMIGGVSTSLEGTYYVRIAYKKIWPDYVEISPLSTIVGPVGLTRQGLTITVAAATLAAADAQLIRGVDQVVVFLTGGSFWGWYEFCDKDGLEAVIPEAQPD